jgi:hypothetical protein
MADDAGMKNTTSIPALGTRSRKGKVQTPRTKAPMFGSLTIPIFFLTFSVV